MTQTRIKQTKNIFIFISFLLNYKYLTTTSELEKNKTSGLALKIRILPFEKLLRIPVTRVQKVREFLGGLLFLAEGQLRE